MGYLQVGVVLLDNLIGVQQYIQVDEAGPPPESRFSPYFSFDCLGQLQQGRWLKVGAYLYHRVQERRLVSETPGFGFIDR
jgi:hypothetical protein